MAHARLDQMVEGGDRPVTKFPELARRTLCEECKSKPATRIVRDMSTSGRGFPTRHVCKGCGKLFVNTEAKKVPSNSLMVQRF